jgi:hypothetical protein
MLLLWSYSTVRSDVTHNAFRKVMYHSKLQAPYRRFHEYKRSEVFTRVNTSLVVFWVIMLCSLVGDYRHFGGTYHHHLQGTLEAIGFSEMLVTTYKTTQHHNPDSLVLKEHMYTYTGITM